MTMMQLHTIHDMICYRTTICMLYTALYTIYYHSYTANYIQTRVCVHMYVYLVGYDKLEDSPSCAIASGDCNVQCSLRFHASPDCSLPTITHRPRFSPQLPICRLHVTLRTRTLVYDKERSQKITSQLERYRPRTLDEQHRQHMSVLRSALWTLGRGCARAASERIPQHTDASQSPF